MKRLASIAGAILIGFLLFVPAVLAADPFPHTGRVIMSTQGDVTVPAGEHADVVFVVNGTATIQGEVNTIVAIDGAANLLGARAETIVAVRSPVEIGAGSVVVGDVMTIDSLVHRTGDGVVQGEVADVATALIGIGAVLGGALFLIWIGFGLAMIVGGLLLAGLASRQVREAETLISREPALTLGVGIVGLFAFPLVAILLIVTVIGAPLGVGILLQVWPLVAFLSYLVGGIWIGDWMLRQTSPERVRERPYLAAVLGVVLLEVMALVPILALVAMIASLFGFGSVLRLSLRTLRSRSVSRPTVAGPMPAPIAG
ncbi:MAG TPA: hypothetical protein VFY18_03240 [Candidatus Limnocylindrales bacterium]|nr:hypothetical protein [Candidatus Limnocylindrales bacterium]